MPLSAGARIGEYEIVSLLGVGGMGEVYRARDTQLRRDVAIKVLPDAFSNDPDRLARFQREAELLAALNHPNIAAIYGLEKSEGGIAIVLELVDGETLADLIARGPIAVADALPIARAITDALEAAHDKGIVHRDLKPANIKLSADGKVKVLDFGLAKAVDSATPSGLTPQLTASPTLTLHATYGGVILGTAAYMSPEQARGKAVDRRTDIWAFGCVLYEMLAGKQAFDAGETVSDAIAAILKHDPDWNALPGDTPTHIRTLLERCLRKDLQKRLPHIGVARLEIDEGSADSLVERAPAALRPRWKRALPMALAAGAAAMLAFGVAAWAFRSSTTRPVVARFVYALPDGQSFRDVFLPIVAISPDGTQIAYVANQRLFLRSMSDSTARPIAGTEVQEAENIGNPIFSPDGQSIAYWARSLGTPADIGTITRIRLQGGAPVPLAQVRRPLGMWWSGDAIFVGQPPPNGIVRVPANGGPTERAVAATEHELMQGPQLLPDGDSVLFTIGEFTGELSNLGLVGDETWTKGRIVVQGLKSGNRTALIEGGTAARYLPSGHLVYAVGGVLMARAFDARRRTFTSEAVPVIEGISPTRLGQFATGSVQMSVSDTGTLVYVPGPATISALDQRDLVVADRSGAIEPLKLPPAMYEHPRVSPNGKQIAYDIDDGKSANVWIYDLSGKVSSRQLTFEGRNRFPIWSPDGQRVVYQSERGGESGIFWKATDGATPAEALFAAEHGMVPVPDSWTPDGKVLFFQIGDTAAVSPNRPRLASNAALWMFTLADKKAAPFGAVRSVVAVAPIAATVSPDGQWVAYTVGTDTARSALQLWTQSISGTAARYSIAAGGTDPQWSPNGRELFFLNLIAGGAFSTTLTTQPHFESGNPEPLPLALSNVFRRSRSGPGTPRNIDIAPDGQHFIAAVRRDGPIVGAQQFDVVLNWFEELKTHVPTK